MPKSLLRPILVATLTAGTLDILAAVILSLIYGHGPMVMLRGVASGPFPDAGGWGTGGSALGLLVHFALMAIMVTIFILAAARLHSEVAAKTLFTEIAPAQKERHGGYTRIIKLGNRQGDAGQKAILEWVDLPVPATEAPKETKAETKPEEAKAAEGKTAEAKA